MGEYIREVSVVIVINELDKVLILKRSDIVSVGKGFWNFPGGGVDEGEVPSQAAVRELKEEADLYCEESDLKYLGSAEFNNLYISFFITDKFSGMVTLNAESTDSEWVSVGDIGNYLFVGGGSIHPGLIKSINKIIEAKHESR